MGPAWGRQVVAAGLLALGACFGGSSSSSSGDGSGGDGGSAGGGGSAGQTGSGDPATCARIASRLRECDIVSAGTVACTARDDPTTRCRLGCLLAARCGTLSALFCEGTDAPEDLADIDPDAARCVEDCEPEPFRCDDGEVIDGDWRCDFERDCVDGSDEAGCRYDNAFTCDDGSAIDNFFQCDGIPDCADRSDELDCVGFECGNGQQIPRSYECDFEPDCLDGSDEHAGCAQLSCR